MNYCNYKKKNKFKEEQNLRNEQNTLSTKLYIMISLLQTTVANANESLMVKDGKIYLVLTIASIIMIGLFAYVTSVDRKLTQLEKNIKG